MNGPLGPALGDTLDYLRALTREGVRPDDAWERLRPLQERYPETPLDLVWLEETYDRSVHYDALLDLPGEGTVSLSFNPDGALAWPLRGVQRWRDQELVRVNDTVLTVDHAIACLDYIWREARIVNRLVDVCLIQEALRREPIALSDDELQRSMNAFRRAHRLHTAADTYRWMAEHGVTQEKLERLVGDEATVARLRDRVAAGRVEAYFDAHRDELAAAAVVRLDLPDAASASRAFDEIRQGADFDVVARFRLTDALTSGQKPPVLQSVVLRRPEVADFEALADTGIIRAASCPLKPAPPPDLAAALFTAGPGDVLGPLATETGYSLLRVVAVAPPCLDAPTREAIARRLFDEWLAEGRDAARIEWYWGSAAQTVDA
ncbi:MAG TPA: TIGR04500 family putative peptide maturation system protein [Chloroflexota bacterium]|jgi:putative peptide maturation system protein